MVVVEENDARAAGTRSAHEIVGCQDLHALEHERTGMPAADPVGAPVRARGERHVVEVVGEDLRRVEAAAERDLDVREPVELSLPVVEHTDPRRQPRQARLAGDTSTERVGGLGEHHLVAALAERLRGLETGRARADDEHLGVRRPRPHPLRMPAATPFLAHRRVLGAADRRMQRIAGDADVAADALADVLEAPLLDLPRQERVGDRRPGRADQVEHAVAHHPHHRVGRGEASDPDDRLARQLLEPADVGFLRRLVREARGDRVEVPVADHEVPHVGELADESEHLLDLAALEPLCPDQLVDTDTACDGGAAVDLVERVLEDLA